MSLVDSLLGAIVRLDGDSLVLHTGEKPYVVTSSSAMNAFRGPLAWGQVELSTRTLTTDAVFGMLDQLLTAEQLRLLQEIGAVENELPGTGDRPPFTVIAARGGDDVWVEIRPVRPKQAEAPVEPPALPATPEMPPPMAEPPAAAAPPAPVPAPAAVEPPPFELVPDVEQVELDEAEVSQLIARSGLMDTPSRGTSEAAPDHEVPFLEAEDEEPAYEEISLDLQPAAPPGIDRPAAAAAMAETPDLAGARAEMARLSEAMRQHEARLELLRLEAERLETEQLEQQAKIAAARAEAQREDEERAEAQRTAAAFAADREREAAEVMAHLEKEVARLAEERDREITHLAAAREEAARLAAVRDAEAARLAAVRDEAAARLAAVRDEEAARLAAVRDEEATRLAAVREAEAELARLAAEREQESARLTGVREEEAARLSALRAAEAERLRTLHQQEAARLAALHDDESKRLAALREEMARLAASRAAEEAAVRLHVERIEKARADLARVEAERREEERRLEAVRADQARAETVRADLARLEAARRSEELRLDTLRREEERRIAVARAEEDARIAALREHEARLAAQRDDMARLAAERDAETLRLARLREEETLRIGALRQEAAIAAAHRDQLKREVAEREAEAARLRAFGDEQAKAEALRRLDEVRLDSHVSSPAERPVATIRPREDAAPVVRDADAGDARPAHVVPLVRSLRDQPQMAPATAGAPDIDRLLRIAAARGASGLYLVSQSAPALRVDGEIQPLTDEEPLGASEVEALMLALAAEPSRDALKSGETYEWFCEVPEIGRMRCLAFRDHRGPGVIVRMMPARAISAEQLGLSRDVQALAGHTDGLLVVAGPRASGKSTLLAALVDLINRTRADHVISIERQLTFVHESRRAFVSQREVRGEAHEVLAALRAALREDPDVLVVEELRSPELVAAVLEASEYGRLVIAGYRAPSASQALERMIAQLPLEGRSQVLAGLSSSLRAVVAQAMLRKRGGGRIAAREVLLNTPAVASVIAEGKLFQLAAALESGRKLGSVPLNDALVALIREEAVEPAEAWRRAYDRDGLLTLLKREGIDTSFVERFA